MKKQKPEGYDVFTWSPLYNSSKEVVGHMWIVRTSGKRTTDWEMAIALTVDLTKMGVAWRILNQKDEVASSWCKDDSACA